MRNREAELRMRQVVKNIMVTSPFFSQLALRPALVEMNELPGPMATDGETIWYNPSWVLKLPLNDLEYVFKHELLHRILGHCDSNENSRLPNDKYRLIAGDLAVNGIMMTAEKYIPDSDILPGCFPGHGMFRNMPLDATRETYYSLMVEAEAQQQQQKQQQKQQQGEQSDEKDKQKDDQGSDGKSEGNGEDGTDEPDPDSGDGNSDDGDEGSNEEDSEVSGEERKGGKGKNGKGKRGSSDAESVDDSDDAESDDDDVAHGSDEEQEESGNGNAGTKTQQEKLEELVEAATSGELHKGACDVISCDENKTQDMKQEVMADMVMAQLGEQVGRGTVGGYGALVAKMLSPPKIPWRRELRQFITARTSQRMNYHKPSRRYREDMITPRRGNKTLGKVIIVADTSGSMASALPKIASEVQGLVKEFADSELYLVMCDAKVQSDLINIGRGSTFDFKTIQWKGLGGTDMCPGFIFAEKFRPALIICATDLAIGAFPKRPQCPVIWCVADVYGYTGKKHAVPYGNMIVIPKSEITA